MLKLRYMLCDVFTERSLTGNALAVFTDARTLDDATMQEIAREMNLSETVFVFPPSAGGHIRIRIFTPARELPFAGHPTLGAAFVVGEPLQTEVIRIETGAGLVPVALEREAARVAFGWMTQPIPRWAPFARAADLCEALGVERSLLPVETYDLGPSHVFVMADSAERVAGLKPDLGALAALGDHGMNVFAGSGERYKTRMFAPNHGVNEDAATGSAAGPLAVHLLRHGRIASGEAITIEQGVEIGRPSVLYARAHGTADKIERVEVGGSAIVIGMGELRLRDRVPRK